MTGCMCVECRAAIAGFDNHSLGHHCQEHWRDIINVTQVYLEQNQTSDFMPRS